MLEALKRIARPVYYSKWLEPYHGVETFCDLPADLEASLEAELPDRWESFETHSPVGETVEKRLKSLGYT